MYKKSVELYGDGIGSVDYVQHMGEDLTVVNSARVSFGQEKQEVDDKDKKQYLGKGSYGSVRLVEEISTGKRYALKQIVKK